MEIDHNSLDPVAQQAIYQFQQTQGRPPMPEETAKFYEKWSKAPAQAKDVNFAVYLLGKASEEVVYGKTSGAKSSSPYGDQGQQRIFLPLVLVLAPVVFVLFALGWDWLSYTQMSDYFQSSTGRAPWTAGAAWERTKATIFGGGVQGVFGNQTRGALRGFFAFSWALCGLGVWMFIRSGKSA
jgi:hypothetical protein